MASKLICTISFIVDVPGIRGQARPRFGRGRTYKEDADEKYEALIGEAFRNACFYQACDMHDFADEVHVMIDTYKHLPDSRPKYVSSEADIFTPDADNIAKAVCDALQKYGAFKDDKQVTKLHVEKHRRQRRPSDSIGVIIRYYVNVRER